MSSSSRKFIDDINYWIKYIDCACSHPCPLPKGKHVYRADLNANKEIRELYDCLYKLYTESVSAPFREPVNALQLSVFNYYEIVIEPMSLRTVLDGIAEGYTYSHASQVLADVDKIWMNCEKFNGVDSALMGDAKKCQALLKEFQRQLIDEQPASTEEVDQLINDFNTADESALAAVAEYFRKEDPARISSDDSLDLVGLSVKHIKVMKSILERGRSGRGR